jgi:hypothetical protein
VTPELHLPDLNTMTTNGSADEMFAILLLQMQKKMRQKDHVSNNTSKQVKTWFGKLTKSKAIISTHNAMNLLVHFYPSLSSYIAVCGVGWEQVVWRYLV